MFKLKVLANKYVNLFVKLAKTEENTNNSLTKIMDIVFGFERSRLKDLCVILNIGNKHNKRFLSEYIVEYKRMQKVKRGDEIESSSIDNVDKSSVVEEISFVKYNNNLILNHINTCNGVDEDNDCKCLNNKHDLTQTNNNTVNTVPSTGRITAL